MNRKKKQLLAGILLACMLAVMMPVQMLVSMAASGKITFSDPTTAVGQEVNVNMKISTADGSLGSADIMLAYDASALEFISGNSVEGGAGSLRAHGGPDAGDLTSIVFSMKFKALKAGASQISITSQEVYDNNSQTVSIGHQGNSTVTVSGGESAAATTSSDGLLTALAVSPGTLTPEFSPSVDSYSLSVGMDVDKVDVQASAAEGAAVTVEGSEGLQMGENTITIKVTAADGITVKNYTISVTKSENGQSGETKAETIEGVSLEAAAKAITILEPDDRVEVPEGFAETSIEIDGHRVTGWVWASESNHQYCVFYAANAAGEKNFYRYDLTEKTIQRYFEDPEAAGVTKEDYIKVAEDYNSLLHDYKIRLYVIIALAAVSAVLLILTIVLLLSRNSGNDGNRKSSSERKRTEPENKPEKEPKKTVVSREERYMMDDEEEDEEEVRELEKAVLKDLDDFDVISVETEVPSVGEEMAEADPKCRKETASEEEPDFDRVLEKEPVKAEAPKAEPVKAPEEAEDDDDFEFIDIDL